LAIKKRGFFCSELLFRVKKVIDTIGDEDHSEQDFEQQTQHGGAYFPLK